jgi:hypothetical protein
MRACMQGSTNLLFYSKLVFLLEKSVVHTTVRKANSCGIVYHTSCNALCIKAIAYS